MSGIVLPFTGRVLLAAYRVVRRAESQDQLEVALAASVLVEALRRGEPVPPDAIDRLVALAVCEHGAVEFHRRVKEALAAIQPERHRTHAGLQVDRGVGRGP